jgi:hypothetical protein
MMHGPLNSKNILPSFNYPDDDQKTIDTTLMMMITTVTEICWWLIIYDKTYFIHVHLFVLLHKFYYSIMHRFGTTFPHLHAQFLLALKFTSSK